MNITITHYNSERCGHAWPPSSAIEFANWFSLQLGGIPEEYRASATIDIEAFEEYEGSVYPHIKIQYSRPETAAETTAREGCEATHRRMIEAADRAAYQKLRARFEPT